MESGATRITGGRIVGGLRLQNVALPDPLPVPPPAPIPMPEGGGDRNSNPIYAFPNAKVVSHFVPEMPLRVSAMRALGAYLNIFAIESFVDELAGARRRRSRCIPAAASDR